MLQPEQQRVLDAAAAAVAGVVADGRYVHTVGAAVMDVDGRLFTGVNVHHFTGGPCAELVALGVAAQHGAGPIVEVAAVGDGGRHVLAPCGRCRQVLIDLHPDCHVVVPADAGPVAVPVRRLLPHSYRQPDATPPRVLRFSSSHWDAVVAGHKTATTRFDDPVAAGPATLLFEFDTGYRSLPGLVDAVESLPLGAITDEQARLEGCSADDLRRALKSDYYPGLRDSDHVDFVRFHVVADSTRTR